MKPNSQQILDWIKSGMTFKPIVLRSKKIKGLSVQLTWDCSEGEDGEYDFQNPDDQPLLRFDVDHVKLEVQDGSYCTQLSVLDDRKLLEKATKIILIEVERTWESGFKRAMEDLSWIEIKNGKVI